MDSYKFFAHILMSVYGIPNQEYISSESVQLLQMAFLHIDVTSAGDNPISGGVLV